MWSRNPPHWWNSSVWTNHEFLYIVFCRLDQEILQPLILPLLVNPWRYPHFVLVPSSSWFMGQPWFLSVNPAGLETGRADSPKRFPGDSHHCRCRRLDWSWDSPSFLQVKSPAVLFVSHYGTDRIFQQQLINWISWGQRWICPVFSLENQRHHRAAPIWIWTGSCQDQGWDSHVISNHLTGALRCVLRRVAGWVAGMMKFLVMIYGSFPKIPCVKRTSKACND